MKKVGNTSIGEKLNSITGFIKNVKFLVLTAVVVVIFGVAIISGDGKNIVQNLYENIIGKKYQTFSPVQDLTKETYLILKDKLSRDTTIEIENAKIAIFEESDISHKYRVEFKDKIYFYHLKKQNGTRQIKQE
jgi:hypothetical protein